MRSRDGSRTYLYTICALIFSFSSLYGEEYIISYRYSVQNAIMLNDSLDISKAMTSCIGKPIYEPLVIDTDKQTKNLQKILLKNSDKFYTYVNALGLHVRNDEKVKNGYSSSLTTVTLKPTCFTVEFNENSVKLTPLKE